VSISFSRTLLHEVSEVLEGTGLLQRPRHTWEGNIRMDIREIGWKSVDWTHMAQDRDNQQALVNLQEP